MKFDVHHLQHFGSRHVKNGTVFKGRNVAFNEDGIYRIQS
jgi:hypothetical protein